jgi:hypothetical protein
LRSVRKLNQENLVGGDRRDLVHGKARREGMEAVEDDANSGMVGAPHDFPGIPVVVDVAAPGQRLEADAQSPRAGALAQFAEVVGGAVDAASRVG